MLIVLFVYNIIKRLKFKCYRNIQYIHLQTQETTNNNNLVCISIFFYAHNTLLLLLFVCIQNQDHSMQLLPFCKIECFGALSRTEHIQLSHILFNNATYFIAFKCHREPKGHGKLGGDSGSTVHMVSLYILENPSLQVMTALKVHILISTS